MSFRFLPLLAMLAGAGCAGDDNKPAGTPPAWCAGSTTHEWDPTDADEPDFFPPPNLFVADASTPTGWALDFSDARVPWRPAVPSLLAASMDLFNEMSGTGTSGGLLLRFSAPLGPVPETAEESLTSAGWQLWDLDRDERVPFEVEHHQYGDAVTIWPLRPLARDTRHAFIVTTDATDASGGCMAPEPETRSLLWGEVTDPTLTLAATWSRAAVDQLGMDPGDVTALTVFHTHDDVADTLAAADQIRDEPVSWTSRGACAEQSGGLLRCEGSMEILDFRDERGLIDADLEPRRGTLPVTSWIPMDATGPLPVVVFGHGLSGTRSQGSMATFATSDAPYVVVAIDSAEHGDHPFQDSDGGYGGVLSFMGIDMESFTVDGYAVRGNFDQTALDRLRLIELLKADPDLDGDGAADIDPNRIGFLGVSLGGITGTKLLALSSDIDAAVLSVPGGRLLSLLLEMDVLGTFLPAIVEATGGQQALTRYHAIAQHPLDGSDPATYAPHILNDRFDDAPAPHLLVQVAMADEVVDVSAGHILARALDIPHMEPVAEEVSLLEVTDADPVRGNLDGRTAAFFQYATVTSSGADVPATHIDTPFSVEYRRQTRQFLLDWLAGDTPRVMNPYNR